MKSYLIEGLSSIVFKQAVCNLAIKQSRNQDPSINKENNKENIIAVKPLLVFLDPVQLCDGGVGPLVDVRL